MKSIFVLCLFLQLCINLQLNDGEAMKIDIDGKGKKKVQFKIDGKSFEIDLVKDKIEGDLSSIPDEILQNQVEEFELNKKLDDNFNKEMERNQVNLSNLTEQEKQEEINNIKVKTLKDQGVSLETAAEFVKEHEGAEKFLVEQFALTTQEYLERLRKQFDLASDPDFNIELDFKLILSLQDEIDQFLRSQLEVVDNDPQDEHKSTHRNIIVHVKNIIDNLFKKLKINEDRDIHNFQLYYEYIDTLEAELKKIN